jgi:A-macroglobulin TED domain/Alpha-2-macroglobulin family/MG2 domain/Carboxypeptidase regulatory-like domain/A-macroglobulin receptor binding domain/Macroglobulin domain MG3/Alpha-2-macroglobulin bait region domain
MLPETRMRLPLSWIAVALALLSGGARIVAAAQDSSPPLKVEEDKMRFHLLPQSGLELPILNSSGRPISGKFALELLNLDDDSVAATLSGTFTERPGETVEKIAWPVEKLPSDTPSELGWYRLRYTFTPDASPQGPPISGIVQLGRIITDGFGISMAAAGKVAPGTQYPVRVHVENPTTRQAYANIAVELSLVIGNDDDTAIKRKARTDAAGNATVLFHLPQHPSDQDGTIKADVARGAFSEEESLDFQFPDEPAPAVTITTDKPLYQPGQTVHIRLLAQGSDKRAMAGAKMNVAIDDEDGTEQFREKVTTSRFGVAATDWDIPGKMQLGTYTITARFESEPNIYWTNHRSEIRISRYELPTFTVGVDPDQSYYLPNQNAVIDVHADYLFGKPVEHGRVKIVRQDNRKWNYAKQQWEADESQPVEGELGSDGHFKGKIELAEDFKTFQQNDVERFEDVTLATYLTDSSTGRTEQRRLKIRLTAQPIHLYMSTAASTASGQPILIYVMSAYADGVPASVDGKIFATQPSSDEKSENGFDLSRRAQIGTFHTNRYGIGHVEIAPLPESDLRAPRWYAGRGYFYSDYVDYIDESEGEVGDRTALLQLQAVDRKGLAGTTKEEVSIAASRDYLRVRTDHTLYHPGDAIHVSLNSSAKQQDLVLNVWNATGLLTSQAARLSGGKASATVPFDPRFRGDTYVTAYGMSASEDEENSLSGWTQVMYPAKEELDVKLKMPQTVFRPGEEVTADLHVSTPTGEPTESALGVLVFDRAVAERVRTDEDFGREYGYSIFDYFGPSYQESIGGVSYRDLRDLDANKPFPEGLDLVAEELVHTEYPPWMTNDVYAGGGWDPAGASGTFAKWLEQETKLARKALDDWDSAKGEYPNSEAEVRTALQAEKIDFDALRDPWGEPFRVEFSYRGANRLLRFLSSGVDKRAGTADDFTVATFHWRYFTKTGMRIDRATYDYLVHTGKYIRDYATLRDEVKLQGVDLDALRDPWGRPYAITFDIAGAYYRIQVVSAGKDGVFASKAKPSWDDVQEWTSNLHYFAQENTALGSAIADQFAATGSFPQNEEQLKPVLAAAKLGPERLIPWGHAYRFTFSTQSRYGDSVTVRDVRTYSDPAAQSRKATEVTPVTQQVAFLYVVSNGPDNDAERVFPVAEYSRVIAEQTSKQKEAIANKTQNPVEGGYGGLRGVVTDPSGATVPNATVAATSTDTFQVYRALADYSGTYAFASLPAGFYQVECASPGFVRSVVQRVPVQAGISTQVDFRLNVGGATETVEVTASVADTVQTESASLGAATDSASTKAVQKPLFTPRLRKYFPETLVWRPEVITDKHGHAHISFPMADNITAWKMSVLASNEAGEVGIAEKELRSFQPFFLELDPPKILTEGDQISLPVVLRNYTDQVQTVTAEMQPAAWFSIVSPAQQSVTIAANGDASSVFTFRAEKSAKAGKQRVTARNALAGDAVEREFAVHPNGQEITFTTSRVLAGAQDSAEVQIPQTAIRGSVDAELRIYPNLTAHVLDAMRGIGATPAGCGEQITSTAYVSLMALQLLKKAAQDKPDAANPRAAIAAQARQTLQAAYDQLVDLQNPDGGFRYWKKMPSSVALTAYVLRFLNSAQDFVVVDTSISRRARDYLVAHQTKTGAWTTYRWDFQKKGEAEVEDPNLTAYIARGLSGEKPDPSAKDAEKQKQFKAALELALDYLEARIDSWSDAYLAGNYAIAAIDSGRSEHIENAHMLLTTLAHREGDTTYWNLEANTTPFYGWGEPGRIETTALAVEALSKLEARHPEADAADSVSRGLQYLLAHKDRYATWYSTQATQNVLEALIAAIPVAAEGAGTSKASVVVNGRVTRTIQLPSPQDAVGPITITLADELTKSTNKIEIARPSGSVAMNASIITSYYLPWAESEATAQESFKTGEKRALRLKALYDHIDPHVGERVHCTVAAERIGFHGYGMMLAEVGLPPGAEVDRASLEQAEMAPGVSGYEIRPDRVVFYLWPTAGGTSFGFDFQMRYRIEAMSAPSMVYDYYNPEANATVAPVRFSVR